MATYLRTTTARFEEVAPTLWGPPSDGDEHGSPTGGQQSVILEQYKIYVEMADRVSARRGLTNTFFLSLNTLIATVAGIVWSDRANVDVWYLSVPVAALLLQCAAWFWLLRSHRQLNSAKYIVIGALEERLPASPYWRAEWKALGEGRDLSRYWPLTHLEQWIPVSFALVYVTGFILAILA
ncbi:RipA family octameric membrane protein [Micromonospora sp. BQ11]|uniref:RipA family octameric membrane protein n=1 Tax=Micromonospora sp. BQ11 TaxID=3452212 RepID=UPI003F8C66A0